MNEIHSRIDVLRPRAGDSIVVSVPGPLNLEQRDHIARTCLGSLPAGVKVMVLDSRVSLAHILNPNPPPEPHPVDAMGFDAWMRDRTERAHREYMERISRLLPCDLKLVPPGAIRRYMGPPRR